MKENKKAITPIVSTVLLIVITIILAIIIWLWAGSFFEERAQKLGMSEDQACQKVDLSVEYDSNKLDITNVGSIPIYGFKIEVIEKGTSKIYEPDEENININIGESRTITVDTQGLNPEKLRIIPILLGESKGIKKIFVCDKKYAKEVSVQ